MPSFLERKLAGRWCPVGTVQRSVSAAASVGAGRLPLADSTRGGSRDPCWHLRCHKDFHRVPLSPRPKRVPPFGISDGGETRRSASAVDSRLWQLATARAHREDSTRSRRGMVLNSLRLVFSHLSGGVWRRPAPRPLRKISPPNGGARGLLFFAAFVGRLVGISVF